MGGVRLSSGQAGGGADLRAGVRIRVPGLLGGASPKSLAKGPSSLGLTSFCTL